MFKIITPMHNAGPWLADNLLMLRRQTCTDFHCLLLDDCSTDDTVAVARRMIAGDSRFDLVCNRVKHYAIGNAVTGMERMRPAAQDVIVLLDGDDRLFAADVLERVAATYARPDCWLTYGSYTSRADGQPDATCRPYSPAVVRANRFRRVGWRASHLKTFRAHLWRHVDESSLRTTEAELRDVTRRQLLSGHPRRWWQMRQLALGDLLDPSGRWFRRCYDKALMYPLLELAGSRSVFVPEVLYWYQTSERRPGEPRTSRFVQRGIRTILAGRPPLAPLQFSA